MQYVLVYFLNYLDFNVIVIYANALNQNTILFRLDLELYMLNNEEFLAALYLIDLRGL